MYRVTKTYGHERGISVAFRQPFAQSHCRYIHGYALAFSFVFEAEELNANNWVIDFGDLNMLETKLKDVFDHRLFVADDDPLKEAIGLFGTFGVARISHVCTVGCESFAKYAFDIARTLLSRINNANKVRVVKCTVSEHGANSATYSEYYNVE